MQQTSFWIFLPLGQGPNLLRWMILPNRGKAPRQVQVCLVVEQSRDIFSTPQTLLTLYGLLEVLQQLEDLKERNAPFSRFGHKLIESNYLASEVLNLLNHPRRIHLLNRSDFLQVSFNASVQDHEAEKLSRCNFECTLYWIQLYQVLAQSVECLLKVTDVIRSGSTLDQHVIHIFLYVLTD